MNGVRVINDAEVLSRIRNVRPRGCTVSVIGLLTFNGTITSFDKGDDKKATLITNHIRRVPTSRPRFILRL